MRAGSSGAKAAPTVIGLLGQYSSRNLGDAAIVHEIVRNLRLRIECVEFVGICSHPDDTARVHRIASFPISGHGPAYRADGAAWAAAAPPPGAGSGTRRIDRLVRSLDLLVMAGGGQLDDYWGGAREQPYALARWSLLSRIRNVPTAFFCVGLDQLATRAGRWLALASLYTADFLAFRDEGTRQLLRKMGLRRTSAIYPDPAFGLTRPTRSGPRPGRNIVVSPICRRSWPGATDEGYGRYLAELARYAEMQMRSGFKVRFVCSQISMDPDAVNHVANLIPRDLLEFWSVVDAQTFHDFVREAGDAEVVVTSRMHGAILSLVAGTPVVAISVARKVDAVMAEVGLSDFCFDAGSFNAAQLLAAAEKVTDGGDSLRARLLGAVGLVADRLPGAFDALAALTRRRAAVQRT